MTEIHPLIDELKTGTSVRKQEVRQILATMGQEVIQPLIETVVGGDMEYITVLLDGIDWQAEEGQRSDPPFVLLRDTLDYEWWYVAAVSDLLVKRGTESVPSILPLLNHNESLVRTWAAHLLGDIGDSTAIPSLIAQLETEHHEERRRAIKALGKLKANEAVEQLINLLRDDTVANAAANALGEIRDLRSVPPLIELLRRNKSVYAVSAALHQFGGYAVEPQIQVLSDSDASPVHDLALMNLWMLGDKRAIDPILMVLETTNDAKTRRSAINALGHLRASQAIEPISRLLYETTTDQGVCAMAIAKIGGKRGFDVLVTALENGSQEVQHSVALAFGEMDSVEDIQPILAALQHSDPRIRSAITVALGNLGDERAVDALNAALTDPDDTTRHYASNSLQKIENRKDRLGR